MIAPSAYLALPLKTRAIILMTLSAIAYALTFVIVRALSEIFSVYMLGMLRAAVGTAILIPWLYRSGVGAFAVLSLYSQICMTRGLALADAVVVMPTICIHLPLATLLGLLLFGQEPEIWLMPGAALIIGVAIICCGVRRAADVQKRTEMT